MEEYYSFYAEKDESNKYRLCHVETPHYIYIRHQPCNKNWVLVGTYLEKDYNNMSEKECSKTFNSIEDMRIFYDKKNFKLIGIG